jgi:penicillin-binding protein 1C
VHDDLPATHEPTLLQGERPLKVTLPTPGLHIARDPRIPDSSEAFPFDLESGYPLREVRWFVDDREVARLPGNSPRYLWALAPGRHTVRATAVTEGGELLESEGVGFWVR